MNPIRQRARPAADWRSRQRHLSGMGRCRPPLQQHSRGISSLSRSVQGEALTGELTTGTLTHFQAFWRDSANGVPGPVPLPSRSWDRALRGRIDHRPHSIPTRHHHVRLHRRFCSSRRNATAQCLLCLSISPIYHSLPKASNMSFE